MKFKVGFLCGVLVILFSMYSAHAWVDNPLVKSWNNPNARMPGTQPTLVATNISGPGNCMSCHGDYDETVEPGFGWRGSMMSQAARDPLFWSCYTVAMQDAIWGLGSPDAGDLCQRCHFPEGWLGFRSDPPNAFKMEGTDYDGVHCDCCHKMYDPFCETTFDGTRESDDWEEYWEEYLNTGPGSGTLSQTLAEATYAADLSLIASIRFLNTDLFFDIDHLPWYDTYYEATGGQYFVSFVNQKRASFADAPANHDILYSRFHKSKYFCGTCHDVSNPALANAGLAGLSDQSGGDHLISEQYPAGMYYHVERTFSEYMLSDYAGPDGADTNPEFAQITGIDHIYKCQNCHLREVTGKASNKSYSPLRPDESLEHPDCGVPSHKMNGATSWGLYILASLDPSGPVYDPCNVAILDKGPEVLTLDLSAGDVPPENNGTALYAGYNSAKQRLQTAATLKDMTHDPNTGLLTLKVQNNTTHKLLTGFPEGRRMFLNIKAYANESLIYEINPYDESVGTLKGLPHAPSSPTLDANEVYNDELVYEIHFESDLTGEEETFHAVLATDRYKDNRIPPKGFDIDNAATRLSEPKWHGESAPDYFTAAEYAGGYDQVEVKLPYGTDYITASLYYQATSREYVEFLRDEINGTADTLFSPTPSGETYAYIIQTDPFFENSTYGLKSLREWGNTIWDLWYHNHGLDGSSAAVEGIVPFEMASASLESEIVLLPPDLDTDYDVDLTDLLYLVDQWLRAPDSPSADIAPQPAGDGAVNMEDFSLFSEHWLKDAP